MDIKGHFNSYFTINQQVFDERFKVILESTVYVYDKNGDLKRNIRWQLVSNWIYAEENIKSKLGNGVDIVHLIFDQNKTRNIDNERSNDNMVESSKSHASTTDAFVNTVEQNKDLSDDKSHGMTLNLELESFRIKACRDVSGVAGTMNLGSGRLDRSSQSEVLKLNRSYTDKLETLEMNVYCKNETGEVDVSNEGSGHIHTASDKIGFAD